MKICLNCGSPFACSGWTCPRCLHEPPFVEGYVALAPEMMGSSIGFAPDYFDKLASVEERSFWFRARNHLILWVLKRYFPRAWKFLEIGCGTGFVLAGIEQAFPNLVLSGSELHCAGLAYARKRVHKAALFQMDARSMPFLREFDLIGAFDVLEHVEEDLAILREIHKSLTDQGGVVLTVPHHKFLWSKTDEDACHVRRYSRKELVGKVEEAGFSVVRITAFVSLLFPLMLAARWFRSGNTDVMDELTLPSGIDWILGKLLSLEQTLIRAGIDYPFGGSLLLIAKKI